MSTFALPDLGEGLQEAEIVAWHVAEGDHVTADEPLVSVETDKAITEIPSPHSGYIAHLLAKAGERVKVGAPLVDFEEGAHKDTGTVMGVLPEPAQKSAFTASTPIVKTAASVKPPVSTNGGRTVVQAAPAARALARERKIDLSRVTGSGPNGLITRQDVERVAAATVSAPSAAASQTPQGVETLRGMRRAMSESMSRARDAISPATLWDQANIEGWWASDHDVTTRLIRAIVAACATVPIFNVAYDDKTGTIRKNARVDLGLAVDTPDGLIVPVIRDAGGRSDQSLRDNVNTLKQAARARTLAAESLRDPTITLSNFGMLAGRHAALVVVPPQVAIVGAGRITLEAVPLEGGGIDFHHILPLSVTFDHRVVTGGDGARFMRALLASLESS
ncbi:MAG TPA: dihydrolipoamide acetyltransferase family protein [Candidatus Acidoferrales bacterium]|nr:dihydrolipoamide acetyltransferase family protein [Candidatus Acidoferrales bacterium]